MRWCNTMRRGRGRKKEGKRYRRKTLFSRVQRDAFSIRSIVNHRALQCSTGKYTRFFFILDFNLRFFSLSLSLSPRDVTFRFSYTFVLPHRVKSILVARKRVSPSIARESIFLIIMDLRKSCLIESDLLKSENKILSSSSLQGEHCIYRNRLLEREWLFLLCPGLNQDSPNFRKHMCWIINAPDVIKSYLHSLATLLFLEPSQFAWKCAPIAKIANFCFTEIHIANE